VIFDVTKYADYTNQLVPYLDTYPALSRIAVSPAKGHAYP
jgi:hypothetical protein